MGSPGTGVFGVQPEAWGFRSAQQPEHRIVSRKAGKNQHDAIDMLCNETTDCVAFQVRVVASEFDHGVVSLLAQALLERGSAHGEHW